jgi:hypothetical protein
MTRATKLGIFLAAGVILLTMIFIGVFSRWGLPKDPKVWKREQQTAAPGTP